MDSAWSVHGPDMASGPDLASVVGTAGLHLAAQRGPWGNLAQIQPCRGKKAPTWPHGGERCSLAPIQPHREKEAWPGHSMTVQGEWAWPSSNPRHWAGEFGSGRRVTAFMVTLPPPLNLLICGEPPRPDSMAQWASN